MISVVKEGNNFFRRERGTSKNKGKIQKVDSSWKLKNKWLGQSLKVKYFIAFEQNVERSRKLFPFLSCCFFGRVIIPPQS